MLRLSERKGIKTSTAIQTNKQTNKRRTNKQTNKQK